MLAGPHPRSLYALRATAVGLAARRFGLPAGSPSSNAHGAPPPLALRASRDGRWPCRPPFRVAGGQPFEQCSRGPTPARSTRFARRPLALPPAVSGCRRAALRAMLAGPHPRSLYALRATAVGLAARRFGLPAGSPSGQARGPHPRSLYALRATAVGLAARRFGLPAGSP